MESTFKHRVGKFWKAFSEEESQIREMMDNKVLGETLINFVDSILQIAFNKVYFEMGISKEKKYELILTPEGDRIKLIQLHYWLQYAPAHLHKKWNFYSSKPGAASAGAAIDMYGVNLTEEDLTIYPEIDNEKKKINLEVYSPKLMALDENQYYSMFLIYLDQFIGEIYSMGYVGYVDFVPEKLDKETVAMTHLKGLIDSSIAKYKWAKFENPYEVYTGYSMKPSEEKNWRLREDIFSGYTSCMPLLNAYYSGETERLEDLKQDGVIFGFLFFENINVAKENIVNFRADIEDKIIEEISDRGIANSLGGATGFHFSYIDFVIYDINSFLAVAKEILTKYRFEEVGFSSFIEDEQPILFN